MTIKNCLRLIFHKEISFHFSRNVHYVAMQKFFLQILYEWVCSFQFYEVLESAMIHVQSSLWLFICFLLFRYCNFMFA